MMSQNQAATDEQPRLGESLVFIRRQRVTIAVIVLLATLAALVVSLTQEPSYDAQSAVAFSDQSQDLGVLGNVAVRAVEPDQLAASRASTVESQGNLTAIAAAAGRGLTADEVGNRVRAGVEPTSNLVLLDAEGSSGRAAAELANTAARVVVARTVDDARARYRAAARSVRARVARLGKDDDDVRRALEDQLTRLVSLQALATPATVARVASVPDSPSSPKPVRDALLGAIVGLLVGLMVGLVRNALDRRMRTIDDVVDELGLPLMTRIGNDALGHATAATGTRDRRKHEDTEAFRILRTNLAALETDRPLTVVAVTSAMPEEGKSTVAASLALANAITGRRTLLVECDGRRSTAATRLSLAAGPGLYDYLSGTATPDAVLQQVPLPAAAARLPVPAGGGPAPVPSLVCITAGGPPEYPTELLGSERFRTFLAQVREVYDFVVLDTCPLLPVADTLELIPEVDAVLYCVRVAQTTREQAKAGLAALDQFPPRPTGLVVTGLDDRASYGGYYGGGYYGT